MAPFEPVSSERINKQLGSATASGRDSNVSIHSLIAPSQHGHSRDSSVSDKISQFNTLASHTDKVDRKQTAAALERAKVGREQAVAEARRYREEARALRKQVEEGKDRERKVGERLENVMVSYIPSKPCDLANHYLLPRMFVLIKTWCVLQESYGRAKETHAHTQSLWEKEIRRTRKETFKSQSAIVKLQEELKEARRAQKSAEESLTREKERSSNREQEAFQARYNLAGVQEQLDKTRSELDQALDRIKTVEQERDAFKTLAKTEEDIARIAAEGRLPLPSADEDDEEDEFASPKKTKSRVVSLSQVEVKSSAASEAEIEELTRLWQWEKQRAERANDHIEYLEAECRLHACSCMKKRPRSSMSLLSPKRQKRGEPVPLADPSDRMILSEKATLPAPQETPAHAMPQPTKPKKIERKGERRATIFLPDQGTFQTVSMEEAEQMEKGRAQEPEPCDVDRPMEDAPAPVEEAQMPERYTRTPSVEPPSFATLGPERASLVSLLNAPQQEDSMEISDPALTAIPGAVFTENRKVTAIKISGERSTQPQARRAPLQAQDPNVEMIQEQNPYKASFNSRPHTTTSIYSASTTTTTIPLREETDEPSMAKKLLALQRTPSRGRVADDDGPTWDVNNPALTPTMTREQALAKIRERRGRAKSGAAVTPRKGMMTGVERREMSAPAGRNRRLAS